MHVTSLLSCEVLWNKTTNTGDLLRQTVSCARIQKGKNSVRAASTERGPTETSQRTPDNCTVAQSISVHIKDRLSS